MGAAATDGADEEEDELAGLTMGEAGGDAEACVDARGAEEILVGVEVECADEDGPAHC